MTAKHAQVIYAGLICFDGILFLGVGEGNE